MAITRHPLNGKPKRNSFQIKKQITSRRLKPISTNKFIPLSPPISGSIRSRPCFHRKRHWSVNVSHPWKPFQLASYKTIFKGLVIDILHGLDFSCLSLGLSIWGAVRSISNNHSSRWTFHQIWIGSSGMSWVTWCHLKGLQTELNGLTGASTRPHRAVQDFGAAV